MNKFSRGLLVKPEWQEDNSPQEDTATNVAAMICRNQTTQVNNREFKTKAPLIIAVASGKGGVGKSIIAANLALSLTRMGLRIAVVDLDIGSANAHSLLGMPAPKCSLTDIIRGKTKNVQDCIVKKNGVLLLTGGENDWKHLCPKFKHKITLLKSLRTLPVDAILLDLGAGNHVEYIDFQIAADRGIIVTTTCPTASENLNSYLCALLFRKLQLFMRASGDANINLWFEKLVQEENFWTSPIRVLERQAALGVASARAGINLLKKSMLGVILNQTRSTADIALGERITSMVAQNFGFRAELLGTASHDFEVVRSVRMRRCTYEHSPNGHFSQSIDKMAQSLSKQLNYFSEQNEFLLDFVTTVA